MSEYVKDPTAEDFLEWAKNNKEEFERFFEEQLCYYILDLEQDDYFGTEGFDKRFA